jgi:hypothetical protein
LKLSRRGAESGRVLQRRSVLPGGSRSGSGSAPGGRATTMGDEQERGIPRPRAGGLPRVVVDPRSPHEEEMERTSKDELIFQQPEPQPWRATASSFEQIPNSQNKNARSFRESTASPLLSVRGAGSRSHRVIKTPQETSSGQDGNPPNRLFFGGRFYI